MARMTLYLNDEEHARLAELAEAAGVHRSKFLRDMIMGGTPTVRATAGDASKLPPGQLREDTQGPMAGTAPHGGEFSKSDQAGKAKR